MWLPHCATILSLALFAATLAAQDEPDFTGLTAPSAVERARAAAEIDETRLLAHYREVLKDDSASTSLVIRALDGLGRARKTEDIALIVPYINHLESSITTAAMDALRGFGRDALKAVKALDDEAVDRQTRKEVLEQLLKDHVIRCCLRDRAINPLYLGYEGRFAELYSVDADVDDLMLRLVRDAVSDIREDINGNRYYYNRYGVNYERPFIQYGALVIAALGRHRPDELMRETSDLADVETETRTWGYNTYSPVTIELATFFARQDKTALVDKLINEFESSRRWRGGGELDIQARIAALQVNALGEHDAALNRLTENLKQAGSAYSTAVSQANYLRARILVHLGEEGAALHALEEAMEASDTPVVLALVDTTFEPLADERRYQAVVKYCELAARRLHASQRPWQPDAEEE